MGAPQDIREDPERFVRWFRHSSPYIHAHRGRTFVVAFGGHTVASEGFPRLVSDLALLHGLGVRLVIVHGAGPQTESRLAEAGAKLRRVRGRHVVDKKALACVKEAVGAVRVEVEALLSVGAEDSPMAGARIRVAAGNLVTARPVGVRDGTDFHHLGEVRRIDGEGIRRRLDAGDVVLLSPLGYSPTGDVFHVPAEEVASATAAALDADKLVWLVDGPGVLGKQRKLVQQLTPAAAEAVLAKGPKQAEFTASCLRASVRAVRAGVRRAHLIDRDADGALMLELFTRDGFGTLVTDETFEGLRAARLDDIPGLMRLLEPLEEEGILVRRPREKLEQELDRFTVVERDGSIIGCAALEPYAGEKIGEIYAVAIHPDYRKTGRGDALLDHVERRARDTGLERVFVLTTRTQQWFEERGYDAARLKALPAERQARYDKKRRSRILIKPL